MKILETITKTQKLTLLTSKIPCGIFDKLFQENESMYSLRTPLATDFYFNRSGDKECGVIFERIYDVINGYEPFPQRIIYVDSLPTSNIDEYAIYILNPQYVQFITSNDETFYTKNLENFVSLLTEEEFCYRYLNGWERYYGDKTLIPKPTPETIYQMINDIIATDILRPKYLDKWKKIYISLVEEQYSAINDDTLTETKSGSRNDETTYDTEVENDGNIGSHETRTYTNETANDVYGFNSSSPVGDSTREDTSEETVVGDASKNTTHNLQKKSGTDTKNNSYEESISRQGRNRSPSELLQMELDFRNKQTMMSIILKDIDEETTLKIYL